MTKKNKLKKLLGIIETPADVAKEGFDMLDNEVLKLTNTLKKKIEIKTFDSVKDEIENFKKGFDLTPLLKSLETLKGESGENYNKLFGQFEEARQGLESSLQSGLDALREKLESHFSEQSRNMKVGAISALSDIKSTFHSKEDNEKQEKEIKSLLKGLETDFKGNISKLDTQLKETSSKLTSTTDSQKSSIEELKKLLEKARIELLEIINHKKGGGSPNRQIKVAGVDVLTSYTDVNLIAGSGMTITTANDNTDKNVDITFTATADTSVTLLDVSANSTTTPNSIYNMTSTIPVNFKSSDGNSLLYLDETNERIGIGTASPGAELHVNNASGQADLWVQGTSNAMLNLISAGSGDSYINFGTNGEDSNLYFRGDNGNSTLMTILDNGNVGIGTTGPGAKLDIIQTTADAEGLRVDGASGGFAFVVKGGTTYTSHVRAGLTVGVNYFTTPPSNGAIIEGNVGIGTASPSYKLTVVDATADGIAGRFVQQSTSGSPFGIYVQATGASAQNAAIYGAASGATTNIGIFADVASGANNWAVYSSNTAKSYFEGNVAIGIATAPVARKLWVQGIIQVPDSSTGTIYVGNGSDLGIYHDGTDTYLDNRTGRMIYYTDSVSDTHNFFTNAAEVMVIGASTITWTLPVLSTSTGGVFTAVGSSTSAKYGRIGNTGTDLYWGVEGNSAGGFFTNSLAYAAVMYTNTNDIQILPAGALGITVLGANGRVGIGTTAPDKMLEINLGTADAFRLTYNDANGSAATYMDTTISSVGVTTFTGAGSGVGFAFAGGNVALGTNSLTLTGSIAATGARVTKGWFTDIESTNMPTVGGTAILTSLTAPSFTTIELGAGGATDTTLSRSAAGVLAVEGVAVPTISSTSTLTNKRITQRVVTTTDDATAVIDVDTTDVYELSAVANNTEFTVTGTPTDGQKLVVRYKDAGVSKTLTWTFATAIGVTLPSATTAGKWGYVGCIYNLAATQWHAVAVTTQA